MDSAPGKIRQAKVRESFAHPFATQNDEYPCTDRNGSTTFLDGADIRSRSGPAPTVPERLHRQAARSRDSVPWAAVRPGQPYRWPDRHTIPEYNRRIDRCESGCCRREIGYNLRGSGR